MIIAYLPVPDLIRQINDRDCFPDAVSENEIQQLINASERLIGRARQELVNRLTTALWAEQKTRDD
jgi:hypothetical protein